MVFKKTFIDYETNLNIELHVKSLDNREDYIFKHQQELLPDWVKLPQTVIYLFFECKFPLNGSDLSQEGMEKDRLLSKFYELGKNFYSICQNQGILSEVICPKDGFPLYSQKGNKIFSIQTLVTRHLSSFIAEKNKCGLIHPLWGKAVYPCVILSVGKLELVKPIVIKSINCKMLASFKSNENRLSRTQ